MMRNPAGQECAYFYGDYYRGRSNEECRLVGIDWKPKLCSSCPVPGILRANACDSMQLVGEVKRSWEILFQQRVTVKATCRKSERSGFDPHVGCGECHPIPDVFQVKE